MNGKELTTRDISPEAFRKLCLVKARKMKWAAGEVVVTLRDGKTRKPIMGTVSSDGVWMVRRDAKRKKWLLTHVPTSGIVSRCDSLKDSRVAAMRFSETGLGECKTLKDIQNHPDKWKWARLAYYPFHQFD